MSSSCDTAVCTDNSGWIELRNAMVAQAAEEHLENSKVIRRMQNKGTREARQLEEIYKHENEKIERFFTSKNFDEITLDVEVSGEELLKRLQKIEQA